MDTPNPNARYAAIIALVITFVVIMVLIVTSGGGDSGSGTSRSAGQNHSKAKDQSQRKIYVVKPGDCCLSQIAQKTGIDVDVLVELNPGLDPQAIHSGDRVKLR
jgi:LysM repeat protein